MRHAARRHQRAIVGFYMFVVFIPFPCDTWRGIDFWWRMFKITRKLLCCRSRVECPETSCGITSTLCYTSLPMRLNNHVC